jgi:tRNA nucleotidyltransferase/poly(A) polymerase
MLRAVVLAARLEFTIDEPILEAIAAHRHEIARSAPARLVEEYYKILRSGHAEQAFRQLARDGLLKEITPELEAAPQGFWQSVEALDNYRARFTSAPESMTNAVLAGTLLHPLGLIGRRRFMRIRSSGESSWGCCRSRAATSSACSRSWRCSRGCSTSRRRRVRSAACYTAPCCPRR